MKLMEQLREQPELMERFQTILQISSSTDGPIRSADEIENLLVEEMRRLGNMTMGTWAAGAEERLVKQFKEEHPSARARKKKR
jgi:2-iminoacetate synthase ThiH